MEKSACIRANVYVWTRWVNASIELPYKQRQRYIECLHFYRLYFHTKYTYQSLLRHNFISCYASRGTFFLCLCFVENRMYLIEIGWSCKDFFLNIHAVSVLSHVTVNPNNFAQFIYFDRDFFLTFFSIPVTI